MGKVCCIIMNVINKAMYKNTVELMHVRDDDKILDIGYGNGYLLHLIYKKNKVDMYGIDISEDMKEQATKRNQVAVKNNQLHLKIGDCCKLSYGDEEFSAVTSVNTVYF